MGVSKNNGTPKWMVYFMETLSKWMIWGYHYFWKHTYFVVVHLNRKACASHVGEMRGAGLDEGNIR